MRCESDDPLFQVSFDNEGRKLERDVKRVGRPRNHWTLVDKQKDFLEIE